MRCIGPHSVRKCGHKYNIDVERVATLIDADSAQAIQDIVINDEKAVDVAKRDGSAHTTISRRVNRGTKALAELLGDDYDLGAL